MRILVVHNYYQHKGGEDVVFRQEVEALRKHHQVENITFQNRKGIKGLLQFALYPWNIFAANKILRKAKDFGADIVHVHNIHYAIGPLFIQKLHNNGFKIVMTLHNYRLICPSATLFFNGKLFTSSVHEDFPKTAVYKKVLDNSWLKTLLTAFVYYFHKKLKTWDKISKYLVLSDFAKDIFLSSQFGINASKFEVKPNFVSEPNTTEKQQQNYFIYIGRLSEEKGIIPFLKAIKDTSFHLKIAGTGPQLDEVKELVSKNPNLDYLGFLSAHEITQLLNNSLALVVPSVCYEGMPMTIIESYALGTPVLASNIGFLNQMVIENETGFHFDIQNKDSILNTLESFSKLSEENKMRISKNCKSAYYSKYTETNNINQLAQVYSSVLNENLKYE